jgi:hypothetical protein
VALLVGVGTLSATRPSLSATPAPKAPGVAILYTSSWDGPSEIFAADPAGRRPVGQVTFAPELGSPDPLPSPDGRKLLYCDRSCGEASTLWLANADGSGVREIITIECCIEGVAWSPDSRRFAYLCCVVPTPAARWGLHVVSADGSTDRVVNSSRILDGTIVWSSDGRHVHLAAGYTDGTRSPNGEWTTPFVTPPCTTFCPTVENEVDNASGSFVASLNGAWSTAWSPDSRLLAYANMDGISVVDPRTRKSRRLSHDIGDRLAWSPDGRLLAYVQGTPFSTPGELRTVTLHGHIHIVATENGTYGGPISTYVWTRVPNGVTYHAPASVSGVFTRSPVTALAVDGSHIAYATCAGVFTWDTGATRANQVANAKLGNNCIDTHEGVSSIALAGDRLVYVDDQGGNIVFWSVVAVSLGTIAPPIVLASGSQTNGPQHPQVAWSGGTLALAGEAQEFPVLIWHIQTVGPSGCPCQEILSFPHSELHLDDANEGRLVVSGDGLLRILGTDGSVSLTLPFESSHAALSGDDLVVQLDNELRDYSVATGTLLHTWQLAPSAQLCPYCAGSTLQDIARGLAAYTADRQLHLLRLSDGSDAIIGPADLARFADTGLVIAAGARVQLIPYGELPLH